jgi:hypothetical protein
MQSGVQVQAPPRIVGTERQPSRPRLAPRTVGQTLTAKTGRVRGISETFIVSLTNRCERSRGSPQALAPDEPQERSAAQERMHCRGAREVLTALSSNTVAVALRDEQQVGSRPRCCSRFARRRADGRGPAGGERQRIASVDPEGERSRSFSVARPFPDVGSPGSASGERGIRCRLRGRLSVTRRLPKQALSYGPIAHLSVGVQ